MYCTISPSEKCWSLQVLDFEYEVGDLLFAIPHVEAVLVVLAHVQRVSVSNAFVRRCFLEVVPLVMHAPLQLAHLGGFLLVLTQQDLA